MNTPRTAYELMLGANRHLLRGSTLTGAQRAKIVRGLLAERHRPGNYLHESKKGDAYPKFFPTPYNGGKKMQTLVPMSPKSYIIADNAYEFEILRLLKLFAPAGDAAYAADLRHMEEITLARLKKTCFGYQRCHYADCFEAGLTVLRFLSFAAPGDTGWMEMQLEVFNAHFADRKRHSGVVRYFWLCLGELPQELALPEITRQRDAILAQLRGTYLNKTGNEDIGLLAARNALARLPAFAHLRERAPYVGAKGRWQFDA